MTLRISLIAGLIVFVSLVYTGLAFVVAMMPGKIHSTVTPADFNLDYERVTLETADGLELTGWFIPQPKSQAVIMIGHGYPYDKGNMLLVTKFLAGDFNLFYFDFRYFGESQGKFTTFGLDERNDVAAGMMYLKSHKALQPGLIGQLGFSLSAATFIQAHHPDVKAMVLDSPFLSLDAMIRDHYRFLGLLKGPFVWASKGYARLFLKRDINRASAWDEVTQLTCPVLFIHGKQDRQIPAWHSQKLYERCPAQVKKIWWVDQADHGETMSHDPQVYQEKVRAFFLEHLKTEAK